MSGWLFNQQDYDSNIKKLSDLEEAVIKQLVKNHHNLLFIYMYLDDAAATITIARYCLLTLICIFNNYTIQYAPKKLHLPVTRSTHMVSP